MLKRNVLRKKTDFDSIYNRGKSVGDRYVVLFYKPNGLAYNRTGFLASKKVWNSVQRNRARRLMKESYRHLLRYPLTIFSVIISYTCFIYKHRNIRNLLNFMFYIIINQSVVWRKWQIHFNFRTMLSRLRGICDWLY